VTSGPIVSQTASNRGKLYVGSLDGFVYSVSENSGRLDWNVSTGQGVLRAPVPFGNHVFVVSGADELYKINAVEGTYPEGWQMPVRGIKKIAGFGIDAIYCIDTNGRLVGIDRKTAAITKQIEGSNIQLVMPNRVTDRMFFATPGGFIQCVHEIGSLRPRFIERDLAVEKPKSKKDRGEDSAMDEDNPFGDDGEAMDDDNPFGDDSGAMDDENPFDEDADDDNPFSDG
jgi:hypothetical protein